MRLRLSSIDKRWFKYFYSHSLSLAFRNTESFPEIQAIIESLISIERVLIIKIFLSIVYLLRQVVSEQIFATRFDGMYNSSGSSHAYDDVQGIEVLRVSLLTQETALRALAESVDRRFQAFEGCFNKIADRLDALAISANRNRNYERW